MTTPTKVRRKTRRAPRRAIIAWIIDRARQYKPSSGIVAALEQIISGLEAGEDIDAYEHGELDDLLKEMRWKPAKKSKKAKDSNKATAKAKPTAADFTW